MAGKGTEREGESESKREGRSVSKERERERESFEDAKTQRQANDSRHTKILSSKQNIYSTV